MCKPCSVFEKIERSKLYASVGCMAALILIMGSLGYSPGEIQNLLVSGVNFLIAKLRVRKQKGSNDQTIRSTFM